MTLKELQAAREVLIKNSVPPTEEQAREILEILFEVENKLAEEFPDNPYFNGELE